jgi:hypothetical protein
MSLSPLWSTIISIAFLILGGIALYTMLSVQGRRQPPDYRRYAAWHRVAGWLFVILFVVMFIFMLQRVENYWEESPARIALHVTFAVALFFLLTLKVLLPRFYPKLLKNMFVLGTSIYLLAFTLVWITAGYYLVRLYHGAPYISHAEWPEHILDAEIGKQLFISRCSVCHLLQDIMQPRDAASWRNVVERMIELAAPRITPAEGAQILHFLAATHTPRAVEKGTILEQHCLPCHMPLEILTINYDRTRWQAVVRRMREYGPEFIPEEKIDEIVDFLVKMQMENGSRAGRYGSGF